MEEPQEIKTVTADERGRITLGKKYADYEVRVAVLEVTSPDWVFDKECPECGESQHLGAMVKETNADGNPTRATITCGVPEDPIEDSVFDMVWNGDGCGNEWEWVR